MQSILFAGAHYARTQQAALNQFQRDHGLLYGCGVFAVGYYVIYLLGSVVVFMLGVLVPLLFVIAHASLR